MKGTHRARRRRGARRAVAVTVLCLLLVGSVATWAYAGRSLEARATALRQQWQREERDGEPATALEPLRLRLDAAQRARALGISSLKANPVAGRSLLADLELASAREYRRSLDASRGRAAAARDRLVLAKGGDAATGVATGQALARAATPGALDALTARWQLEADMVPVDRAVADREAALTGAASRARSFGVSDAPAPALEARVSVYAQQDAPQRKALASPLLDDLARGQQQIVARIDASGLTAGSSSPAAAGCPAGVTTLLNRRTAPLSPSCAPGFRAQPALDRMLADMRATGLHPLVASTYRSYQVQAGLYGSRVQAYGAALAGEYTAPPGYSEHQLGLAVDLASSGTGGQLVLNFDATPEGRWLLANAARYGFILRYPAGKVAITGYAYEPWHFRYLGAAASSIPAGTTLEEYEHQTG